MTSSGPSVARTASRCAGFRSARYCSGEATTTLRLGTLVSPATFRHPSVLARNAATADEVAGGRVTLGIGAGWMEREHDAYGFEFATARERVARFAEQLEIVHRLLREDRVEHDGRFYELRAAPGLRRP